ncbi:uncharacterized protein LOC132788911 [Drosophila nasuta]|uniref:uncharacterized protein LOC132788911 n=1 Tax=Drosophila nasuta TaxID=42062 RepID=UPI00295E53B8|nr:uncharacterized protein LOC132788911 [Drosophila nasuta]
MHGNAKLFIFLIFGLCATLASAELSGLFNALQYLGLKIHSNGTGSSAAPSAAQGQGLRGGCRYSFDSYALMSERHTCAPGDEHILHLTELPQQRKPPLLIRCLQQELTPQLHNITGLPLEKLLIMKSAKDIVNLLKPIGNATKRHEYGSCVVVHFCTRTSLECARVAPAVNLLPHLFPTLKVAYIDAFQFTRFNAEFGIVSLPTLMIFHQGRPLIKYDPPWQDPGNISYAKFIMRHTNIKYVNPRSIVPALLQYTQYGPLINVPDRQTDFYVGLSWLFILICLGNYMRRTLLWKQLVEMVQRNWRESEETQMEMVD